ncbi:MAG: transporter substrate-binding domain-containing protein [Nitrospinaceae bacterium]
MSQKCRVLAVLWLLLAALAACQEPPLNPAYRVATDATLAPMSFIDDGNRIAGFEVDLMQALAEQAGFGYELINVEWAGVIGGVITRKYDMAISSITILDERKKKMAFTIPYLQSGLSIVVRRDTQGVRTLEDLAARNLKVGAQRGTTAYFFLEKHPRIRKVGYEQYGHAVADLIKGEVDAVIGESTGTLYYKSHDNAIFEKIKMVGEILTEEHYGIIVHKDNPQLLAVLNRALAALLANGTVQTLHAKWDLGTAAAVPRPGRP